MVKYEKDMKVSSPTLASTLPKPHGANPQPRLCQRAFIARVRTEKLLKMPNARLTKKTEDYWTMKDTVKSVDNEVLRNRHLRVAANRCMPC